MVNRKGVNVPSNLRKILVWTALLFVFSSEYAFAQPLETLNASYASVTGSRIPLWIAKDSGLFEKHGLNVNLVVIAAVDKTMLTELEREGFFTSLGNRYGNSP